MSAETYTGLTRTAEEAAMRSWPAAQRTAIVGVKGGAARRTRTPDQEFRKLLLYPPEL
jgi:hypothetical protein